VAFARSCGGRRDHFFFAGLPLPVTPPPPQRCPAAEVDLAKVRASRALELDAVISDLRAGRRDR